MFTQLAKCISIYVTLLLLHYSEIPTFQLPMTVAAHSAVFETPHSAYLLGGVEPNSIESFTKEQQFVSVSSMSR